MESWQKRYERAGPGTRKYEKWIRWKRNVAAWWDTPAGLLQRKVNSERMKELWKQKKAKEVEEPQEEQKSFEELYQAYLPWRIKTANKFFGRPRDEVEQTLAVGMWDGYQRAVARGETGERVTSFMLFVGYYTVRDEVYGGYYGKKICSIDEISDQEDPREDVGDSVVLESRVESIRENVEPLYRKLVDLLVQGLTHAEIADRKLFVGVRGEPVGRARLALIIKQKIRPAFEEEFADEEDLLFQGR